MNEPKADQRSNMAKGIDWATRISSACLSMVLPSIGGYYLDNWLGTKVVFLLVGLVLGMTLGIYQLVRLANSVEKDSPVRAGVAADDRGGKDKEQSIRDDLNN
jgi:F0F1-type ATP synthase assembly protein I